MRPSSKQLLAGIKWSFETYAVPDIRSRLGLSAARSIDTLLDHLLERVDGEGEVLTEDNEEMRTLFRDLTGLLGPALGDGAGAELRSAVSALHEKLEKQYRPAGSYPHVESLTEENEDLKRTLVGLIQAVQGHRSALSAATHEEADRMIRAQLRSQLDREHQWIAPILGKRPY